MRDHTLMSLFEAKKSGGTSCLPCTEARAVYVKAQSRVYVFGGLHGTGSAVSNDVHALHTCTCCVRLNHDSLCHHTLSSYCDCLTILSWLDDLGEAVADRSEARSATRSLVCAGTRRQISFVRRIQRQNHTAARRSIFVQFR